MAKAEVLATVTSTCDAVLNRRGIELVEVSLRPEGRGLVLRVTVDRVGEPVSVDEIAQVSEEISRALDLEDPISERYILEVSSAGLERPLLKPSDYERFVGHEIRVKAYEPLAGQKVFQGVIVSAGPETFVLGETDRAPVEIAYEAVSKAKLVVDWDKEFRRLS